MIIVDECATVWSSCTCRSTSQTTWLFRKDIRLSDSFVASHHNLSVELDEYEIQYHHICPYCRRLTIDQSDSSDDLQCNNCTKLTKNSEILDKCLAQVAEWMIEKGHDVPGLIFI